MTEINKALFEFWSQFTLPSSFIQIPAFLSGRVPQNTEFPYITFEVKKGSYFSFNFLTAFIWCKIASGVNANQQRATILDQIAKQIPEQGKILKLDNNAGIIKLERNSSDFQSYFDDENDNTVIGGRISYQVTFYNK